jgi:DNA methylase
MIRTPYERNDYVESHSINKKFEEVLWMSEDEFRSWVVDMRKVIVFAWDRLGLPPATGWSEAAVIRQLDRLNITPITDLEQTDELTGTRDCLETRLVGIACNQFFPTMMKTPAITTKQLTGSSIYDYFSRDDLLEPFLIAVRRLLKKDSKYVYSSLIPRADYSGGGKEWIQHFVAHQSDHREYGFWLDSRKIGSVSKPETSLGITAQELKELVEAGTLQPRHISNVDAQNFTADHFFRIRYFKYGQSLFPKAFSTMTAHSFAHKVSNFPPLNAKYLYTRFTDKLLNQDRIVIYDPSAGWGGRILGAMSVSDDRHIHYVGTDPNPDHWIPELGITKYEYLADYFNKTTHRSNPMVWNTRNTHEIFQVGSEVIHREPYFQKYKAKIDLVFTSPPYFAKEGYSDDAEQSYKKFSTYSAWRDGFLAQTLQTCVEYLKPNRFLLWNVADVNIAGKVYPLEQDSIAILKSLGMKYRGFIKMMMGNSGLNRMRNNKMVIKNFCKVKGRYYKYEPVFVFYKPAI